MARARNIKPGFFSNDDLVELPFEGRLLFIGIWTIADRAGRLLDRPKKIKMDLFPADDVNVDSLLDQLAERGFLRRYEAEGMKCIQVTNWAKHQNPHFKEVASALPEPDERRVTPGQDSGKPEASLRQTPDKPEANPRQASEIPERAGLIPDSLNLIPDSGYPIPDTGLLIPDTLQNQPTAPAVAGRRAKKLKDEPNPLNLDTWKAYKHAYANRYGVPPVQNAKSNTLVKNVVMLLGSDSPGVAAFFVGHNGRNYVAQMHQLRLLLLDAEKLRTEWATNHQMTAAAAQQVDRTATNASTWGDLIAEARAREQEMENAEQ